MKKKLRQAPSSPGIYIMKDARGKVIYVGKAKNLRNRLSSYFGRSSSLDERKMKMAGQVSDFDYVVTGNELEALILEANFIKRVKPRYNIILRDDKNYPYLKLTLQEEWPRLEVVRRIHKDGSAYFGPYVPAGSMWEMLKFIRRTFPIRMCRYKMDRPFRPCVQHQMGRCLAPCSEDRRTASDREKYRELVDDVRSFIQGEKKELLTSLRERMHIFSENLQYEEAALIRDRLEALERAWESQRVIDPGLGDLDVIGLYRGNGSASIFMLFIRNGTVIGQKDFFFKNLDDMDNEELVAGFIEQFYTKELVLPPRIILPVRARLSTQEKWLSERRGSRVRLASGRNKLESRVLGMANENALFSFNKHREVRADETVLGIKDLLHLKQVPGKIAAVDISNIAGSEAVGGLVVYENGKFIREDYRTYRIKTVQGIDDFAMIGEVVGRYLRTTSADESSLPELILIDGGPGQLRAALDAMKPFGLQVELAAMAKAKNGTPGKEGAVRREFERVYLPGRRAPIYLDPFQRTTHLLQKIRDEVHRFVINSHRKLRTKRTLASPLEKVSGIGKTRRLLLLRHFGSIDRIRKASVDDIASLKGMNRKVARDLKEAL